MDLRVFTEPQQGATFPQLVAVAQRAEQLGFSGFFRSDHYRYIGDGSPRDGVTDAWITLAGLAVETTSIRLGTLMSSATFRLPGPLAVAAAQVDSMSGGRLEIGIGSGWYEAEHQALGIPFPSVQERFDRLTEQLEILQGLWSTRQGEAFTYYGRYYTLTDCPVTFRPAQQPHPPVLIGGYGRRRTPALAARFAAEFNVPGATPAQAAEQFARVDKACEELGRDPESLKKSVWVTTCIGKDDAEYTRRATAIGRSPAGLREQGIAGLPSEAKESLRRFESAGAERVYLQFLTLDDLDHLDLIAEVLLA
ncbi:MAG TPA: LLM class F420-dependent oxidoreductase [Streptosporangiaceae bacterium]|nr:LLM class F420-dependent oxidoreductase [Streptosporangiaceae bacterium]